MWVECHRKHRNRVFLKDNGSLGVLIWLTLFSLLLSPVNAITEDITQITPKILPDSPFYIVKVKIYEPILVVVGDNELVRIDLAQLRLAEMREMAKKGKMDKVEELKTRHKQLINEVQNSVLEEQTSVAKAEKGEKVKLALEHHARAIERLQALLASETMPEASKKGLENALMAVSTHHAAVKSGVEKETEKAEQTLPAALKEDLKIKARKSLNGWK